jgi:hypothetical protein
MAKNKRNDKEKALVTTTARNKIAKLKKELVYAGGNRVDFLNKRITFWEGKK